MFELKKSINIQRNTRKKKMIEDENEVTQVVRRDIDKENENDQIHILMREEGGDTDNFLISK
jgi:hypothetical protein